MTLHSDRRAYVRTVARGALTTGGWFGYSPLGRPLTWRERTRRRWQQTSVYRLLTLPTVIRRARAAYVDELGTR